MDLNFEIREHSALARYILARRDWGAALASLAHISAHVSSREHPLYLPLSTATVICYARPFLGSKPFPGLPGAFERFSSAWMKSCHNDLLRLHHQVVAHADRATHKVTLIPDGSILEANDGSWKGSVVGQGDMIRSSEMAYEAIPNVRLLLEFQVERIKIEILSRRQALFKKAINSSSSAQYHL